MVWGAWGVGKCMGGHGKWGAKLKSGIVHALLTAPDHESTVRPMVHVSNALPPTPP